MLPICICFCGGLQVINHGESKPILVPFRGSPSRAGRLGGSADRDREDAVLRSQGAAARYGDLFSGGRSGVDLNGALAGVNGETPNEEANRLEKPSRLSSPRSASCQPYHNE